MRGVVVVIDYYVWSERYTWQYKGVRGEGDAIVARGRGVVVARVYEKKKVV